MKFEKQLRESCFRSRTGRGKLAEPELDSADTQELKLKQKGPVRQMKKQDSEDVDNTEQKSKPKRLSLRGSGSRSKPSPEHDPQAESQTCEADSDRDGADKENSEQGPERRKKNQATDEEEPQNPFQVPKKDYNRRIFEAVNPFVEVTSIPVGKTMQISGDKVADGRMVPEDVLETVADLVYERVAHVCNSLKQPETEMGGRPIHWAYLQALWYCTRISSNVLRKPEYLENQAYDGEMTEAADEDVADMQVKVGGSVVVKLDAPTSDESFSFSAEEDDPAEQCSTDLTLQTKYDLKVRVDDKRTGGKPVTVLVVECGWDKLPLRKTYQAAGYAMKDVANNMKRGRYEPLFLQAWGKQEWRHGLIIPRGLVIVANGRILEVRGLQKAKLERHFRWRATVLAKDYQLQYPDGEYVAAEMFVFEEKFFFNFLKFKFDDDTDHFLSSLLRIIVGDRTLSWSIDDCKGVVEERLKMVQKQKKNRKRKGHQSSRPDKRLTQSMTKKRWTQWINNREESTSGDLL